MNQATRIIQNKHQQENLLSLEQGRLNIDNRTRTSRLPWKGQFSPELIEYLITTACSESRLLFDPFCGSGTVLYEAARFGLSAIGYEVNPAAWHLANLSSLSSLPKKQKVDFFKLLEKRFEEIRKVASKNVHNQIDPLLILEYIFCDEYDVNIRLALSATLLLAMGDKNTLSTASLIRSLSSISSLIDGLLRVSADSRCYLADARLETFSNSRVDGVITSPPYINVFNYHQNYRPAVELLGWKPLEAARSEIGANRKHRQNRFLTVIQYCLDISRCITATANKMENGAPFIIVIGRTSNVLGTSFSNSSIMQYLIDSSCAFTKPKSFQRVFKNRFGEDIYEDILISHKISNAKIDDCAAQQIGLGELIKASYSVPEKNRALINHAIDCYREVAPSPELQLNIPTAFRTTISKGN